MLCNRSKHAFHHVGNRRFRLLVENHAERYSKLTTKSERSSVVLALVKCVMKSGGNFITLDKCATWIIVTPIQAIEKVGHALRAAVGFLDAGVPRTIYDVLGVSITSDSGLLRNFLTPSVDSNSSPESKKESSYHKKKVHWGDDVVDFPDISDSLPEFINLSNDQLWEVKEKICSDVAPDLMISTGKIFGNKEISSENLKNSLDQKPLSLIEAINSGVDHQQRQSKRQKVEDLGLPVEMLNEQEIALISDDEEDNVHDLFEMGCPDDELIRTVAFDDALQDTVAGISELPSSILSF